MSDIASLIERLEKATGAIARAFAKLDRQEECWLWTGGADAKGRGRVWIDGRIQLVHRAIWSYLNGPIQPGMLLCHHCDNPRCANPFHLYVGTHADNMRDMRERRRHFSVSDPDLAREVGRRTGEKNTWVGGQQNPKAKLTEAEASLVRMSRETTAELARRYGVHRTTIQRIRRGAQWSR